MAGWLWVVLGGRHAWAAGLPVGSLAGSLVASLAGCGCFPLSPLCCSATACLPAARFRLAAPSCACCQAWLRPPEFFEDNNIEYQLGCNVTSVDTVTKTVRSSTGNYQYTKLLVATGGPARSFKPPERFVIPGAEARNIFVLRDSTDAEGVVRAIESFVRPLRTVARSR